MLKNKKVWYNFYIWYFVLYNKISIKILIYKYIIMINYSECKKFFLFILIGSLVIAALVAVVTVLTGEFNEILARSLWTLGITVVHVLISLGLIWDNERQNSFESISFFINVLFLLIGISFITSIFGIWKIIPSDLIWKFYQSYIVIGATALHADILSKALNKEKYMDMIVYINYAFIVIVALMLQPIIFIDNASRVIADVYFRILGATAIIDGTLSVLLIIFYKLYMNKLPKTQENLENTKTKEKSSFKKISIWVWIILIYLIIQVLRWVF